MAMGSTSLERPSINNTKCSSNDSIRLRITPSTYSLAIGMSGVYNQTYFDNHPHEKEREGVLYGVILVNQRTFERECIKVGIASGKDWRHVIKRSRGFKGYDLRIQRTFHDTIYNCWKIEQELHKKFEHDSYKPQQKFGGHTECFKISSLILQDFPKNNS